MVNPCRVAGVRRDDGGPTNQGRSRRFSGIHMMAASMIKRAAQSLLSTSRSASPTLPTSPPKGGDPATSTEQPSDITNMSRKPSEASKNPPTLPIPPLEDSCRRYLRALEGLQEPDEHTRTKKAVEEFLNGDGPRIQARLKSWAAKKAR